MTDQERAELYASEWLAPWLGSDAAAAVVSALGGQFKAVRFGERRLLAAELRRLAAGYQETPACIFALRRAADRIEDGR